MSQQAVSTAEPSEVSQPQKATDDCCASNVCQDLKDSGLLGNDYYCIHNTKGEVLVIPRISEDKEPCFKIDCKCADNLPNGRSCCTKTMERNMGVDREHIPLLKRVGRWLNGKYC